MHGGVDRGLSISSIRAKPPRPTALKMHSLQGDWLRESGTVLEDNRININTRVNLETNFSRTIAGRLQSP